MKYFYTDTLGNIVSCVDTGGSEALPAGAVAWPADLDFHNALSYGYDSAAQEFILIDRAQAPSEFHVHDCSTRTWVYQLESAVASARNKRDWELGQMDGMLANPLRWAAMSQEQKDAWAVYRQALLDVPQQAGFPQTIDWPQAPQ